MPKQISESELDTIKQVVKGFDEGASIDDIQGVLELKMPRRTLQRRLAFLVERSELILEGVGRGSRYKVKPPAVITIGTAAEKDTALPILAETYIPVSEKGGKD